MSEIPCDASALIAELEADEGRRHKRYRCPAGHWTIGVGHNLETLAPLSAEVWSAIKAENEHINNGLLNDQARISDKIIDMILFEDIQVALSTLDAIWIGWRALSECRKRALINLAFQMGYGRLIGFVRFWRALRNYDYERAAAELVDSLWFRQTQASRTSRVVSQIRDG